MGLFYGLCKRIVRSYCAASGGEASNAGPILQEGHADAGVLVHMGRRPDRSADIVMACPTFGLRGRQEVGNEG